MDLIISEIIGSFLVFGVLVCSSFLPYFFVRFHARRSRAASKRNSCHINESHFNSLSEKLSVLPWFSLCNCFAAGVFLATCFIGLVPHVREHVKIYEELDKASVSTSVTSSSNSSAPKEEPHVHKNRDTPWTELLLVVGFLSVLLLDEIVQTCRRRSDGRRRPKGPVATLGASSSANKQRQHLRDLHYDEHPHDRNQDFLDGLPLLANSATKANGSAPESLVEGVPLLISPADGKKDELLEAANRFNSASSTTTDSQSSCSHSHHDPSAVLLNGESLTWRSAALLLSLGIHGLFEGVALGLQETSDSFFRLLFGVMTHETLCAVAFGINLAGHGVKTGTAMFTMLLLAATVPSGMLAGLIVRFNQSAATSPGGLVTRIVLEGFAAGTFVYVAFFDMLNHELSESGQKYRLLKIVCVWLGFFLFFFITTFL